MLAGGDLGDRQLPGHGRRLERRTDRRAAAGPAGRGRAWAAQADARTTTGPTGSPRAAPCPGRAARGRGLPVRVLQHPAPLAAALAPGRGRRPRPGRHGPAPHAGVALVPHGRRRRGRASTSRPSSADRGRHGALRRRPARGDGVPAGVHRAASACTSGRWSTAPGRAPARPAAAAGRRPAPTPSSRRIRCGAPTSTPSASSRPPPSRSTGCSPPGRPSAELEQPGCLHAAMDLYKWACKLGPAVPGELAARLLRAGRRRAAARHAGLALRPGRARLRRRCAIETPEGKAEYVAAQRGLRRAGARRCAAACWRSARRCRTAARRTRRRRTYGRAVTSDAHRPLAAARRHRQHPRPRRAPDHRRRPHRARPDPAQRQPADPQRRRRPPAGRGDRPARGGRPADDAPRSCSRAAARCATSPRSPTGTSRLLPERGHHTDVFAVEEDDPLRAARRLDGVDPAAAGGRARPGRAAGGPLLPRVPERPGRDVIGALRALAAAGRRVGRALRGGQGPHRRGRSRWRWPWPASPHEEIVADYAMTAEVIDALVAKLAASPDVRRGHGTAGRRQPHPPRRDDGPGAHPARRAVRRTGRLADRARLRRRRAGGAAGPTADEG